MDVEQLSPDGQEYLEALARRQVEGTAWQEFPYPTELADLVVALGYKPGWEFDLRNQLRDEPAAPGVPPAAGLTLVITIECPNAYNHDQPRRVRHYMPVPPATFGRRSWRRWLLDQIIKVETHEACEFFEVTEVVPCDDEFVVERVHPFAPHHGVGEDPYTIYEVGTRAGTERRAGT